MNWDVPIVAGVTNIFGKLAIIVVKNDGLLCKRASQLACGAAPVEYQGSVVGGGTGEDVELLRGIFHYGCLLIVFFSKWLIKTAVFLNIA